MIVDDQINNARLVTMALNLMGHQSVEIHCGKEALDAIEREQPDLVLLDYMMPGQDGLETLRQIRARFGNEIPVYILTAAKDLYLEEQMLASGADGYFSKPIDLDQLEEVIVKQQQAAMAA